MNILKRLSRASFVRNIGGAVAGGLFAMMLYGMYHVASPLFASLLPAKPAVVVTEPDASVQSENMQKVVERAKEILAR